ncbi:tyrosine-type recombinase/integrase [Escherichia coli]|nr:tyrosine-type recombinase/integrase [Escherichia coli]
MKTATAPLPPLRSVKVLDQLRERIRYLHYSLRTEQAYVHWVRAFIRFHGVRHPATLGSSEVEAFLSWLANERKVSVSTHRQALAALLFFYGKVLCTDLPWLQEIGRPRPSRRLPVVLTPDEVVRILGFLEGEHRLFAQLLYGTGMRISEGLQLRVKDLDFDHGTIIVREGKGSKDRALMGTVAKLAMRQPFVLFKGLTFQKLCLPGAFRPGDHHNKMLRPGLCVVHASPQYL